FPRSSGRRISDKRARICGGGDGGRAFAAQDRARRRHLRRAHERPCRGRADGERGRAATTAVLARRRLRRSSAEPGGEEPAAPGDRWSPRGNARAAARRAADGRHDRAKPGCADPPCPHRKLHCRFAAYRRLRRNGRARRLRRPRGAACRSRALRLAPQPADSRRSVDRRDLRDRRGHPCPLRDLSDRSTGRCDHGGGGCGASAGAVAEACRMSSAALGMSRESFARDRARAVIVLLALLGAAAALLLGSTAFGSTWIPLDRIFAVLVGSGERTDQLIVLQLRLPRVLLSALAGGAIAISGYMLQKVTRNDLASPSVLGVVDGAALGVVIFLACLSDESNALVTSIAWQPVAAAAGAVTAVVLVFALSGSQ